MQMLEICWNLIDPTRSSLCFIVFVCEYLYVNFMIRDMQATVTSHSEHVHFRIDRHSILRRP